VDKKKLFSLISTLSLAASLAGTALPVHADEDGDGRDRGSDFSHDHDHGHHRHRSPPVVLISLDEIPDGLSGDVAACVRKQELSTRTLRELWDRHGHSRASG